MLKGNGGLSAASTVSRNTLTGQGRQALTNLFEVCVIPLKNGGKNGRIQKEDESIQTGTILLHKYFSRFLTLIQTNVTQCLHEHRFLIQLQSSERNYDTSRQEIRASYLPLN
jgi:hypothetical protein